MKRYILILILLAAWHPNTQAQAERPITSVSLVPIHLWYKAIRVDIEQALKKENHALSYSLLFYSDNEDNNFDLFYTQGYYDQLLGYGVKLRHEIYLPFRGMRRDAPYFSYGFSAEHFILDIPMAGWVAYNENGLEYLQYKRYMQKQQHVKLGPSALIGIKTYDKAPVVFDFYLGTGFRYTYIHNEANASLRFKTSFFDYGYTGMVLLLGVKVGGLLNYSPEIY